MLKVLFQLLAWCKYIQGTNEDKILGYIMLQRLQLSTLNHKKNEGSKLMYKIIQVGVGGYGGSWLSTIMDSDKAQHVALIDI